MKAHWLVNLSNTQLTKDGEDVLRLGPEFAPTLKTNPYMDFVAGIEEALFHAKLPQEHAEEIKGKVCSLFRKAPRPNKNFSRAQLKATKLKKEKDNIVILKVDKGNTTVMMDKEEYHKKCLTLLQPPMYVSLPKDPTAKLERRVIEVLKPLQKEKAIDKTLFGKLRSNLCRARHFYGLSKIHITDNSHTPIVSAIGSPAYHLAKFITSIFPLTGNTLSFAKSAKHFSEMVTSESVTEKEAMVSFDVQYLFTSVPIDKALEVINRRLAEDKTLEDRPGHHALRNMSKNDIFHVPPTVLQTNGRVEGATMGSPVLPVVANIFMEFVEEVAISTSPSSVRF